MREISENERKWIDALRSGKFVQGKTYLIATNAYGDEKFCCMGVGCELAGIERKATGNGFVGDIGGPQTYMPPADLGLWLGLATGGFRTVALRIDSDFDQLNETSSDAGWDLSWLNDDVGLTFDQIADLIEHFGVVTR